MEVTDLNLRKILGLDEPPARELNKNRRGVTSYSSKDTGNLQIFTNESWERLYNKRMNIKEFFKTMVAATLICQLICISLDFYLNTVNWETGLYIFSAIAIIITWKNGWLIKLVSD